MGCTQMKHQTLTTTLEISKRMANVHLKEGKAETKLAKELWRKGLRYRKNYKKLPGSPDIAVLKYHIAVFVDGEFWHGKDWGSKKEQLKSNRAYWIEKIEENIARDKRNDSLLSEMGWKPIHFWEKDVNKSLQLCVDRIMDGIIREGGNKNDDSKSDSV